MSELGGGRGWAALGGLLRGARVRPRNDAARPALLPRALFAAASPASRIAANCAPPPPSRSGSTAGREAGARRAPRGNYRCSRRRPPGQRLRAAAEINWRRQPGAGAAHDPES